MVLHSSCWLGAEARWIVCAACGPRYIDATADSGDFFLGTFTVSVEFNALWLLFHGGCCVILQLEEARSKGSGVEALYSVPVDLGGPHRCDLHIKLYWPSELNLGNSLPSFNLLIQLNLRSVQQKAVLLPHILKVRGSGGHVSRRRVTKPPTTYTRTTYAVRPPP